MPAVHGPRGTSGRLIGWQADAPARDRFIRPNRARRDRRLPQRPPAILVPRSRISSPYFLGAPHNFHPSG
jgi:hypothetical protein